MLKSATQTLLLPSRVATSVLRMRVCKCTSMRDFCVLGEHMMYAIIKCWEQTIWWDNPQALGLGWPGTCVIQIGVQQAKRSKKGFGFYIRAFVHVLCVCLDFRQWCLVLLWKSLVEQMYGRRETKGTMLQELESCDALQQCNGLIWVLFLLMLYAKRKKYLVEKLQVGDSSACISSVCEVDISRRGRQTESLWQGIRAVFSSPSWRCGYYRPQRLVQMWGTIYMYSLIYICRRVQDSRFACVHFRPSTLTCST